MSLSTATRRIQYTLTSAGQTLPVPFKFFTAADLAVVQTIDDVDSFLVITTDYLVTGGGVPAAIGSVVMVAGAAGDIITIYGNLPETQDVNLTESGPFPPKIMTAMVDRVTMLVQQLKDRIDRTAQISLSADQQAPFTMPTRANMLLGFDAFGNFVLIPQDGPPPVTTGSPESRVDITDWIGGAPNDLDSLISADFTLNCLVIIQIGGPGEAIVTVQLAISSATPVTGIVTRPPDWASTGRQWITVG